MQRNTIIEDSPQESVRRGPPNELKPRPILLSPLSDSFPTPRAHNAMALAMEFPDLESLETSSISSDTPESDHSMWSKRSSESEYDEMYDMTGSESEGDVPIALSGSVKKRVATSRRKFPPIAIPSPRDWPTVDKEKLKSAVTPLSPPPKIELSSHILARLKNADIPSNSATPSLDGNSTDDDFIHSSCPSCPSTPDLEQGEMDDSICEVPIQLDPSSMSLLRHMHGEEEQPVETVIEVSEEAIQEMREIVDSPFPIRLSTQNLPPADPIDAQDEMSELSMMSVPSPSIFFASVDAEIARHTSNDHQPVPNTGIATEFYDVPFRTARVAELPTSTAANFYDLPWTERPDNPVEHVVSVGTKADEETDPITAKRIPFSPLETVREVEDEVDEIDESYDDALKQTAAANIDRTVLWLTAQSDYMKAVCDEDDVLDSFIDIADATPKTPDGQTTQPFDGPSPNKKSVRWADEEPPIINLEKIVPYVEPVKEPVAIKPEIGIGKNRVSPIHDGTFWEGWRHTKRSQRARDVFQHRQARAEAEHVKRTSCQKQHLEQLQGKYEITSTDRPAPPRPISNLISTAAESDPNGVIERAERERQALEQMQSSSWHLAAHKEISGGKLLISPIVESFKGRKDVRILDLGGQVHCGWAWSVAMEHPIAEVYTIVSSDAEAHVAESGPEGPSNHTVVAAPRPWEMPFEDNHFDVISAQNLYANLKTNWPKGHTADEWDLTLRECLRCLKPGGYLEFNLMDAELVHPEPACQALGVEFAFNLKTRGYDPYSGKTFLPRLKRAGFNSIKRAWMVLPVADVLPRWMDSGKGLDGGLTEKCIGPNGEVELYAPPATGSTKDVRAMTGIVGARMWEHWMLKLHGEMGRSEDRCLEGVAKALEECGKGNAGWRCLVGWARKGI